MHDEDILRRAHQVQCEIINDFVAAAARVRAGTYRRNRHGRSTSEVDPA